MKMMNEIDEMKVKTLFDELIDLDLLEDRREYAEDDLKTSYPDLNDEEVKRLYKMIQDQFQLLQRRSD